MRCLASYCHRRAAEGEDLCATCKANGLKPDPLRRKHPKASEPGYPEDGKPRWRVVKTKRPTVLALIDRKSGYRRYVTSRPEIEAAIQRTIAREKERAADDADQGRNA